VATSCVGLRCPNRALQSVAWRVLGCLAVRSSKRLDPTCGSICLFWSMDPCASLALEHRSRGRLRIQSALAHMGLASCRHRHDCCGRWGPCSEVGRLAEYWSSPLPASIQPSALRRTSSDRRTKATRRHGNTARAAWRCRGRLGGFRGGRARQERHYRKDLRPDRLGTRSNPFGRCSRVASAPQEDN
jgi:hypothetical protein